LKQNSLGRFSVKEPENSPVNIGFSELMSIEIFIFLVKIKKIILAFVYSVFITTVSIVIVMVYENSILSQKFEKKRILTFFELFRTSEYEHL